MQNEQICIITQDSHKQLSTRDPRGSVVWHPLERLEGHILIPNVAPENVRQLSIYFEGCSRVWFRKTDDVGNLTVSKSSYKFLYQSQELSDIQQVEASSPGVNGSMARFYFVIPRWTLATGHNTPSQCLSLPPSFCTGEITSEQSESYAQPSISYRLKVEACCLCDDGSQPKSYKSHREIMVIPYTEMMPPTDTRDFPSEFIESSSKPFRKSYFGGPTYLMKLSINEPPPIRLDDTQSAGVTDAEIVVEVTTTGEEFKESALEELPDLLRKLSFHIDTICRAKTFYSTTPFSKLPGQTMLTLSGRLRLRDDQFRLNTSHVTRSSWQHRFRNTGDSSRAASSTTGPDYPQVPGNRLLKWSTTILQPIVVPPDLLPTFCSAIVARQYSLITRVNVTGASVGHFSLEVPLQITYGPSTSTEGGAIAEESGQYNFRESSTLAFNPTIDERLGLDNNPDEDLPCYT